MYVFRDISSDLPVYQMNIQPYLNLFKKWQEQLVLSYKHTYKTTHTAMQVFDYVRTLLRTVKDKAITHHKKIIIILGLFYLLFVYYRRHRVIRLAVQFADFLNALSQQKIQSVSLNKASLSFVPKSTEIGNVLCSVAAAYITKDKLVEMLKPYPKVLLKIAKENQLRQRLQFYLKQVTAIAGSMAVGYLLATIIKVLIETVSHYSTYQFGHRKLNRNLAKKESENHNITFKDVYGLTKAKQALSESIDYMKNPDKYLKIGCRLRRGIIFYGPPGTGKTLLAKATAGETEAEFIFCSASEFVEMYVGVGAKRVRQLFFKARSYKSAILFIDEIDALGNRHTKASGDSQRNATLNQFLTEMDGFTTNGRVLVIAATNRLNMIDEALLRPGRFDLKIEVGAPCKQDRLGILNLHLSKKKSIVSPEIVELVAQKAEGMSGADLENVTNEAAYEALKKNCESIEDEHLLACFRQLWNEKYSIKYH